MDLRTPSQRKRDLNDVGNDFYAWVLRAQELLISVTFLINESVDRKYNLANIGDLDKYEDEIEKGSPGSKIYSIILMLWAMAAECLLKALWLKSGEQLYEDGQYQAITKNDHQLDKIANTISKKGFLIFSKNEINILARLSNYIVIGRYPVPKNANIRIAQMPDGSNGNFDSGWNIPCDDEAFGILVGRMFNVLSDKAN
jgi:hypothetical protein